MSIFQETSLAGGEFSRLNSMRQALWALHKLDHLTH